MGILTGTTKLFFCTGDLGFIFWGTVLICISKAQHSVLYTYIYFNEYLSKNCQQQEKRVTEACSM